MLDLRELYQEVILDHNKNPRNYYKMANASCHAEGFNPLCGDRLTLYLRIINDQIDEVSFEGSGCAISTASTSLMTEFLKGKTRAEAETLFQIFHRCVMCEAPCKEVPLAPEYSKLSVLAGVREFPARVKCATLAWHTLRACLQTEKEPVTTE